MSVLERLRQAHCEQTSCNSCLAACIATCRVWSGELAAAEAASHEQMLMQKLGASPHGLNPEAAAHELQSLLIRADPDDPNNLTRVWTDVESLGWWHIAMLYPGPLLELQARQNPRPRSPHGDLTAPLPHHAVVLAAVEADCLLYLDPWFPRRFQPRSIALLDFARAWTGRYIPVRLA